MEFFAKNPMKTGGNQEAGFLYVGPEPFRALAVALIDGLKHKVKLDETSLKKLLNALTRYFPKLLSVQPYSTTLERIEALITNRQHKSEAVDCLAYTLRQLALDVVFTKPLEYQDVIEGFSPQTTLADLRSPSTLLPVKALEALTETIEIRLILSQVEQGKELRALKVVPEQEDADLKIALSLQVQGGVAFPKIKDKKEYANVGPMPLRTTHVITHYSEFETIAPLLHQIDVTQQCSDVVYEQTRKTLLAMVVAGELSKQQLLELHVEFTPTKSNLVPDEIFSKLQKKNKIPVATVGSEDAAAHDIALLVDSFAQRVSLKQIDGDDLFERIAPVKAELKPRGL